MLNDDLRSLLRHPSPRASDIKEPARDTVIWKYLDLAKYLALLRTRNLHLAPTTEFCDRYEGDIGVVQKKALVRAHGQERYEELMEKYRFLRERTYVSCWTENEFESDAMWRIYTGAIYGVAIRSTYGRLRDVFADARKPNTGLVTYIGRVNYVDFSNELLNLESYHLPFFYKRRSFEHEREVRMVLQDLSAIDQTVEAPPSHAVSLTRDELNGLISSLHLSPGAPNWFKALVRDVNFDYGLDREPIPSALDEIPS